MQKKRVESLVRLCELYLDGFLETGNPGELDEGQKKYMALEIIDAYKCGELQQLLKQIEENEPKEYGFMDNSGDLKLVYFTDNQVKLGELRGHIAHMKDEGYTYLGLAN